MSIFPDIKLSAEEQKKLEDIKKLVADKQKALSSAKEKLKKLKISQEDQKNNANQERNSLSSELLEWLIENNFSGFSESIYKAALKKCFENDPEKLELMGYDQIGNNKVVDSVDNWSASEEERNPIEAAMGI